LTQKFFASQTLLFKINNDWINLKDEQKEFLRQLILKSLIQYSNINPLLKKLSVTFSMFVLFQISEGEFKNIFDFFSIPNLQMNVDSHVFSPNENQVDVRIPVLEWLTVLPEQIDSCNLVAPKK
jgi:hypothetical protein